MDLRGKKFLPCIYPKIISSNTLYISEIGKTLSFLQIKKLLMLQKINDICTLFSAYPDVQEMFKESEKLPNYIVHKIMCI